MGNWLALGCRLARRYALPPLPGPAFDPGDPDRSPEASGAARDLFRSATLDRATRFKGHRDAPGYQNLTFTHRGPGGGDRACDRLPAGRRNRDGSNGDLSLSGSDPDASVAPVVTPRVILSEAPVGGGVEGSVPAVSQCRGGNNPHRRSPGVEWGVC